MYLRRSSGLHGKCHSAYDLGMRRRLHISAFISAILLALLAYNNCGKKPNDSADALSSLRTCTIPDFHEKKAASYGSFIPTAMDHCHAYNGGVARWSMGTPLAMVSVSPASFNNGVACGGCIEIVGPKSSIFGRVSSICNGCANDVIHVDDPAAQILTGGASGGMLFDVQIREVECPLNTGAKLSFFINSGTTPTYLNLSPVNHRHPIDSIEIKIGSSPYAAMTRTPNSNDFSTTLTNPAPATVKFRVTDIYGQSISSSASPAANSVSMSDVQFGDCD